jgi:hypothetical protein
MHSIRSRTLALALVLGWPGVALAVISWVSYRDAQHEVEELFDALLVQTAQHLDATACGVYWTALATRFRRGWDFPSCSASWNCIGAPSS